MAITPDEERNPDQQFVKLYSESQISRQDDGTYCAGFPWKPEHPPLPDNFNVCQKRTRSLAHRLAQSPGLLQIYDSILKEQLERGFIELVPDPSKGGGAAHYIPHHPVKKDSTTTPVRIVYDCSCQQSSEHPSLNDCLVAGPPLLADLCAIILRFRMHQYGISTDIEKAFLHITLKERDRDFTRFLWLSDPLNSRREFSIYHFRRVLFGTVSSPFILFATLHHHLQQHSTPLSHNIRCMQTMLYQGVRQYIQFYHEARSTMNRARFTLRACASIC